MDFLYQPPKTLVVQASLPRTLYRDCQIGCVIIVTHSTLIVGIRPLRFIDLSMSVTAIFRQPAALLLPLRNETDRCSAAHLRVAGGSFRARCSNLPTSFPGRRVCDCIFRTEFRARRVS